LAKPEPPSTDIGDQPHRRCLQLPPSLLNRDSALFPSTSLQLPSPFFLFTTNNSSLSRKWRNKKGVQRTETIFEKKKQRYQVSSGFAGVARVIGQLVLPGCCTDRSFNKSEPVF
jgi:hypothetical protein